MDKELQHSTSVGSFVSYFPSDQWINYGEDFAIVNMKYREGMGSPVLEYPCRFDGYFLIYCVKGSLKLNVDMTEYELKENMLFLARDFISYDMAKEMFPDIAVKAYPDIVTTLIGTLEFKNQRKGVCLCTRNDGEKYYTDEQLASLASELEKTTTVHRKDTQGKAPFKTIRENLQHFIEEEIESYSHFDVTITDRYHGTIFSLCAGTPVIIIKTTDHKVTTGADWFKGIYDDYVYVAKDLDDAYNIYKTVKAKQLTHKLKPHMKNEYYDKLKSLFENI